MKVVFTIYEDGEERVAELVFDPSVYSANCGANTQMRDRSQWQAFYESASQYKPWWPNRVLHMPTGVYPVALAYALALLKVASFYAINESCARPIDPLTQPEQFAELIRQMLLPGFTVTYTVEGLASSIEIEEEAKPAAK